MKLFVYGIFLGADARFSYGMTNPKYCTVRGYATVGEHIVYAVKDRRYTLTGLLVDVDQDAWTALDSLEYGYDRVIVETTDSEWNKVLNKREPVKAYMYVKGDRDGTRSN